MSAYVSFLQRKRDQLSLHVLDKQRDYIEMAYLFETNTTEVASDHYYQE